MRTSRLKRENRGIFAILLLGQTNEVRVAIKISSEYELRIKKALLSENILDFIPTCERAFCAMGKTKFRAVTDASVKGMLHARTSR